MENGGVRVPVSKLATGKVSSSKIVDETGRVLVNAGVMLTTQLQDSLLRRGIENVVVQIKAGAAKKGSAADEASRDIYSPMCKRRQDWTSQPYDEQVVERVESAMDEIHGLLANIMDPSRDPEVSVDELLSVPEPLIDFALEDQDVSIASTSRDTCSNEFQSRTMTRTVLSIATAIEMGHIMDDVIDVGRAALLHDYGLSFYPARFRDPLAQLDADDEWEYRKHPAKTSTLLRSMIRVPSRVRAVIMQIHERLDGTGYPLGLKGVRISPLARIIGVCGTYVDLIHAATNRPPFAPHQAILLLRHWAGEGIYDEEVVAAFVRNLSLYPIGSRVILDNGSQAQVIRRAGDEIRKPTVKRISGMKDSDTILPLHELGLEITSLA